MKSAAKMVLLLTTASIFYGCKSRSESSMLAHEKTTPDGFDVIVEQVNNFVTYFLDKQIPVRLSAELKKEVKIDGVAHSDLTYKRYINPYIADKRTELFRLNRGVLLDRLEFIYNKSFTNRKLTPYKQAIESLFTTGLLPEVSDPSKELTILVGLSLNSAKSKGSTMSVLLGLGKREDGWIEHQELIKSFTLAPRNSTSSALPPSTSENSYLYIVVSRERMLAQMKQAK